MRQSQRIEVDQYMLFSIANVGDKDTDVLDDHHERISRKHRRLAQERDGAEKAQAESQAGQSGAPSGENPLEK